MSDLSVVEKDVGSWLSQHASALGSAANVLTSILSAVPVPAAQAISGVISGIEGLAANAKTVAANVTTATATIATAPTLASIENTVETEAFNAAKDAAQAAFDDLMSGKPVATIETDALTAAEGAIIAKGTSN